MCIAPAEAVAAHDATSRVAVPAPPSSTSDAFFITAVHTTLSPLLSFLRNIRYSPPSITSRWTVNTEPNGHPTVSDSTSLSVPYNHAHPVASPPLLDPRLTRDRCLVQSKRLVRPHFHHHMQLAAHCEHEFSQQRHASLHLRSFLRHIRIPATQGPRDETATTLFSSAVTVETSLTRT